MSRKQSANHAVALATTLTATTENMDPDDDEGVFMSLTTLRESERGEGGDPEDDGIFAAADRENLDVMHLMTTTATKASGDPESDDEDDDVRAQITTLHQGPESDDADENLSGPRATGNRRPLGFRFSEPGVRIEPTMRYDENLQVHVLPSGRIAVDVARRLRNRR